MRKYLGSACATVKSNGLPVCRVASGHEATLRGVDPVRHVASIEAPSARAYIGWIADKDSILQAANPSDRGVIERGSAALDLRGTMPCAGCGYELQGLTIRGECPECGLPVRATLLARVDPKAPELATVHRPVMRVIGLGLWVVAGLGTLLITWALRVDDAAAVLANGMQQLRWLAPFGAVGLVLAGLGTLAFAGATAGTRRRATFLALLGSLLHLPLAWLYWRMQVEIDAGHGVAYFDGAFTGRLAVHRAAIGLSFNLLLGLIVLFLRPAARSLVKRSAVLRRKAVDRQTLLAMTASLTVGGVGHGLLMFNAMQGHTSLEAMGSLGTLLVGLGSVLLTIASVGVAFDTLLLMPVVLRRPLSLEDVFAGKSVPASPSTPQPVSREETVESA